MLKVFMISWLLAIVSCAPSGKYGDDSLIGYDRPSRDYPQTGYVLGDNGKYVFKPLTMSRR